MGGGGEDIEEGEKKKLHIAERIGRDGWGERYYSIEKPITGERKKAIPKEN